MAKLCRKLKWLVFFWDTVYICELKPTETDKSFFRHVEHSGIIVVFFVQFQYSVT